MKKISLSGSLLPALVIFSLLISCQQVKKKPAIEEAKPVPTTVEETSTALDSLSTAQVKDAQAVLGTTLNAVRFYRADQKKDPPSFEELVKMEYLAVDDGSKLLWDFSLVLIGDSLTSIKALSTAKMKTGSGHEILFDVNTGNFTGYGIQSSVE